MKNLSSLRLSLLMFWLLLGVIATNTASAQVASYVFSQRNSTFSLLTGGTVLATSSVAIPPNLNPVGGRVHQIPVGTIPFSFLFNGTPYTGAYVSSSGYLTFGAVPPHSFSDFLPNSTTTYVYYQPLSEPVGTGYDGAISPMGSDLLGDVQPGDLGEVRYQLLGTAPNRVFVVQWKNIHYFTDAASLNFQVRLHETTNEIEMAYGPHLYSVTSANFLAQVGLRGFTTSDFQNRAGAWLSSTAGTTNAATIALATAGAPPDGLVYSFVPPTPLPCPQPYSLVAVPVGNGTSANVSWHVNGPSANPGPYLIQYGPAGFVPGGAGSLSATAPGLTTTLTGLSPLTNYDFYVTQQCGGAAGTSPRSLKGSFKTTLLNDDPIGATPLPLTATCQPVSSTNVGATITVAPGYNSGVCSGVIALNYSFYDVWFAVTTAATGPGSTGIQLAVTGGAAARVKIYSSAGGAAGPFTLLHCEEAPNNSLGNQQPAAAFVQALLTPNTTYYVAVANIIYDEVPGPFTICATVPPACSNPAAVSTNFGTTGATTSVLTFTPSNGAIDYTVVLTPAGGVPVTVSPNLTGSPATLSNLTPATTYAGTLQANCAGGAHSAPVPFIVYAKPINDNPPTAIALPVLPTCQPVNGSNLNAAGDHNTAPFTTPNCGTATPYGVWYTFTTAATGLASQAVRITVTGAAAGQVRVFSASSASGPFTPVACAAGSVTAAAPPLDVLGLTPSTTYYVFVGDFGFATIVGPFTICITEPPTCGDPLNLGITALMPTSATLTFTAGVPTAATYAITLTPQGGTTANLTATSPQVPLTGLQPGTYYTATVQGNCGTGGLTRVVSFTFLTPGVPANDLCSGAIALTCGQTIPGTTIGSTATGDPTATCGATPIATGGVWYRVLGTGQDLSLTVRQSGPVVTFGPRLHVYTGTCGALTCVAGVNIVVGACGCSQLTLATTAGTTYYLFVSGHSYAAQTGDFTMQLDCLPAGTCPAPTNAAIAVTSPTSVQLTFTPAAGASQYVVTWVDLSTGYVTGSTTVTTSPAVKTQLSPNTSYMAVLQAYCGALAPLAPTVFVPFNIVLASRAAALTSEVALFPNPAHATATLVLPAALRVAPVGGQLYNALGQVVQSLALPAGSGPATLDLRGLPAGGYLLRLTTAQGVIGKRLMVE